MSPSPVTAARRGGRPVRTRVLVAGLVAVAAGATGFAPAVASADDPVDLRRYYRLFDRGPALVPGHDTSWTPQGLAYWAETDDLVISYYDSTGRKRSRLAIVDRSTGARRKLLVLPTKGHVGGLAMSPRHLWVANGGRITRFAKRSLSRTKELGALEPAGSWKAKASSFLTYDRGSLWVGRFVEPLNSTSTAYRYPLNGKDVPRHDGGTMTTPSRVQGMAIVGDRVVWSRSWGRDSRSRIETKRTSAPTAPGRTIIAPNMSEGIVSARGELHVVYESGSSTYADASYRVRTIHHAPLGLVTQP